MQNNLPQNALQDVRVFLVDDEDILAWSIETELKSLGAEVLRAGSLRQALERFPGFNPDFAITDLRLPDGNGLDLLQKWRKEYPNMPVILITAHGAIDSAVTALRLGAFDYLQKPFDLKDLMVAAQRAAEMSALRQKVSRFEGREKEKEGVNIIGNTPAIKKMRDQLRKVATSKANSALILGDSGTGKELAARALHEWSDRSSQPFVEINCASIPETLLESELFGYEKGAFTDARERKIGLFEMARSGTIFLDEIGEMPLKLQSKLLRALEYRRFKRLGGTKDIEFSARIVAATNRNLLEEVAEKRFRGDLFYRLNVLPIYIPRLSERIDDIPTLTDFLVQSVAKELSVTAPKISADAIECLKEHDWPGNVRELRNVIQRAIVFHSPDTLTSEHIEIEHLPEVHSLTPTHGESTQSLANQENITVGVKEPNVRTAQSDASPFALPDRGVCLDTVEKSLLTQALEKSRNNQTKAAQLLGISRHTLRYRLEKHGIMQASN